MEWEVHMDQINLFINLCLANASIQMFEQSLQCLYTEIRVIQDLLILSVCSHNDD